MGAWTHHNLDNDDALGVLAALEDEPTSGTLNRYLTISRYELEDEAQGASVLAAAEMVAAAAGKPAAGISDYALGLAAQLPYPSQTAFQKAIRSVSLLLSGSGIAELHDEALQPGEPSEWRQQTTNLLERLEAAAAQPSIKKDLPPRKRKVKIQERPGDIVKVPFEPPWHTYALVTEASCLWFYDLKTQEEITDMERIRSSPVIYKMRVNRYIVLEMGIFPIVGHIELTEEERKLPQFFRPEIAPGGIATGWLLQIAGGANEFQPITQEQALEYLPEGGFTETSIYDFLRMFYAGKHISESPYVAHEYGIVRYLSNYA